MPFGGYKMSGYGREAGIQHMDEFRNVKAVWIKTAQSKKTLDIGVAVLRFPPFSSSYAQSKNL
jgi:hypothetical protein